MLTTTLDTPDFKSAPDSPARPAPTPPFRAGHRPLGPYLRSFFLAAAMPCYLPALSGCRDAASNSPPSAQTPTRTTASSAAPTASVPPTPSAQPLPAVRVESVAVPNDLPVFVIRGSLGLARMVFLDGFCSHSLPHAESFQKAAAHWGTLIAMQADMACSDASHRRWTNTTPELDARIEAAFRASGDDAPLLDLAVIGYSEGAVLAAMLAHRRPDRYARVVLIGSPQKPEEYRFRRVRSTAMIAPELDRHDLMQTGKRELEAAGIPSAFYILPGARHGEMGPEADRVMDEALRFVWTHERQPPQHPRAP